MAFLAVGDRFVAAGVVSKVFIIERKSGNLHKVLDMQTVTVAPLADKSGKMWYTAEIQTLCCQISAHDRWLAVSDNRKRLFLWNLNNLGQSPKCVLIRKQATNLCFAGVNADQPDSGNILVADRFGHVTEYPIKEMTDVSLVESTSEQTGNGEDLQNLIPEEPKPQIDFSQDFTQDTSFGHPQDNSALAYPQPFPPFPMDADAPDELEEDEILNIGRILVGEISMLLDIKLSTNEHYLATCDRDEKIRISRYPNTYNIENYCLGHGDYVRTMAFTSLPCCGLPPKEVLISGSGDRTIKVWDYLLGKCLLTVKLAESEDKGVKKLSVCEKFSLVSVLRENAESVLVYKLRCSVSPEETKVHAELVSEVDISQAIWSAALDEEGKLWVLTRKQPGSQVENANAIETYLYHPESQSMEHCRDFAYKTALDIGKMYERAWEDMPRLAKQTGFRNYEQYRERQEEKFRSKRARLEDFEDY